MNERLVQVHVTTPYGQALFEFWLTSDGLVRAHGMAPIEAKEAVELDSDEASHGSLNTWRARVQVWP